MAAVITAACVEARDLLAAAPEPADDPTVGAFIAAADDALRAAAFPIRDLLDDLPDDDPQRYAVRSLEHRLDHFPRLIGNWTPVTLAFTARASIPQIDALATELGVPECDAATWRANSWLALSERLNTGADADPSAYSRRLGQLCQDTFATVSTGGLTGEVGGVMLGVSARSSIDEFHRQLRALLPPTELQEPYVDALAALVDIDRALPDVAGSGVSKDNEALLERAGADLTTALADLGAPGC